MSDRQSCQRPLLPGCDIRVGLFCTFECTFVIKRNKCIEAGMLINAIQKVLGKLGAADFPATQHAAERCQAELMRHLAAGEDVLCLRY